MPNVRLPFRDERREFLALELTALVTEREFGYADLQFALL
jgi:hypothetical protein